MRKGAEFSRPHSSEWQLPVTSLEPQAPAPCPPHRLPQACSWASRTYPMGFPALWKSFRTRSTSLLTLQSFPSTANVLLQREQAASHLRAPGYLPH